MSRHWNSEEAIPEWVNKMTDVEIVEHFKKTVQHRRFQHERVGREIRDMRKRLLKILLDGLERKPEQHAVAQGVYTNRSGL